MFLTTGTSGGVYPGMSLGDVVVSHAAQFQCLRDFKAAPFNGKRFESKWMTNAVHFATPARRSCRGSRST